MEKKLKKGEKKKLLHDARAPRETSTKRQKNVVKKYITRDPLECILSAIEREIKIKGTIGGHNTHTN